MIDGRGHEIDPPARDSVAHNKSPTGPATGPVLLWLVVQLAALSVAALRIPMAAKYPQPAELLATHLVLATQVIAGALLFPYVLGDWRTAIAAIAAAWPFAVTASILSATPLNTTAAAEAYVSMWLLGLAVWCAALPGPRWKSYGLAVAATLTIGAGALWYLAREFDLSESRGVEGNGGPIVASPLLAALRLLAPQPPGASAYFVPTTLAASGLLVLLARLRNGRARISTARPRGDEVSRPITS